MSSHAARRPRGAPGPAHGCPGAEAAPTHLRGETQASRGAAGRSGTCGNGRPRPSRPTQEDAVPWRQTGEDTTTDPPGQSPSRTGAAPRGGPKMAEGRGPAGAGPEACAGRGPGAGVGGVGGVGGGLRRRGGATKMAASGLVCVALCLLCASDLLLLLLLLPPRTRAAESPAGTPGQAAPPPPKKKKDIRDYNDADMARLLEQWEVRGARTPSGSALPRPHSC